MPGVVSNEELLGEGDILQTEMRSLQENLKNETRNMHSANDQISKIVEDLEETQTALRVTLKLVKIDAIMQKIKLLNESKKFKNIHNQLNLLEAIVEDPEDKIIRRLDCIKSLKHRITVERCNLKSNLENDFNRLIQLKEKNFPKTRAVTCIISKNVEEIVDCIHALVECGFVFESFIEFLMKNVFGPVVSRAVSLDIKENDRDFIMSLSYSTEPVTDDLRPTYPIVVHNLEEILTFFINMNIVDSEGHHFLATTFQEERIKVMDMLFNNCLKFCIPKTFEEKAKCTMKEDIHKLSQIFLTLHFSDEEELDLVNKLCDKIDDHFHQQFTENVQTSASELLKRDLHDMILISDDATFTTSTPLTFPKAMISKSTLELIKLLERMLQQANECEKTDVEKRKNLLDTIKNVLENYTFTVQLHHSQLLTKIPQQSALFYNNCHYLSNWILTNKEFQVNGAGSVVNDLKRQGEEFFDCQVAKQKIQLLDILKDFGKILLKKNIFCSKLKNSKNTLK